MAWDPSLLEHIQLSKLPREIGNNLLTAKFQPSVNGITSKLDYLQELGIDIVWVSPSLFYHSAQSALLSIDSIQKSTKGLHILEQLHPATSHLSSGMT